DREFEAVGGNKTHKVDVRMILATNLDLEEEVKKGTFRQDLFYRINVVTLTQPPLRERISDIPLLVEHYLKEFVQQTGKPVTGISEAALTLLQRYRWAGNVRELVNVIERAVVLTKNTVLQPHDLPEGFRNEESHVDLVDGRLPGSNLKAALAN